MAAPTHGGAIDVADERSLFQKRIALVFAADFVSLGLFMPFFPVWLAAEGLSADEVGIVLALQTGLRILTVPAILRRADRAADRADVLLLMAFASAVLVNVFFFVGGFPAILAATVLVCLVWAPLVPLTDAIALSGVRRLSIDYGRARLWGSLAFVAVNLVSGFAIARFGIDAFLPMMTAAFLVAALAALAAPRVGRPRFASPLPTGPTPAPVIAPRGLLRRLKPGADIAPLMTTMLALGLVQSSHAMYNGFSSILWTDLGYSGTAIGVFWSVGVIAEILVFRFSSGVAPRLGVRTLLLISAGAGIVRWLAMGFDLGFAGFAILGAFHGLTFGLAWVALQATIASSIGEGRIGSAQGVGFALQTGLTALATLASGPLYAAFHGHAFAAMAVLSAAAILIALRYPQRSGAGGQTFEPS